MAEAVIESLPATAAIVHVGPVSFVMPWLDFRVTPSQGARIEVAAMLAAANDHDAAQKLLAEVEAEMAREAKRRARLDPEGRVTGQFTPSDRRWDIPYSQPPAQRSPAMDKFDRVSPIQPEGARLDLGRLNDKQRELMDDAETMLAEAEALKEGRTRRDKDGNVLWRGRMTNAELTLRRAAKDAYDTLQASTLAVNERDSLKRRNAETMALADGGEVIADDRGRLTRRNGLDTLFAARSIDQVELAAGEKYAEVFDAAKSKLKIASWNGAGGGSPDQEAQRQARLRLLAAQERLTLLHAVVQARTSSPRAITTLRLVAGEGRPVSHFSKGASRALNVKALKEALNVLADLWALA